MKGRAKAHVILPGPGDDRAEQRRKRLAKKLDEIPANWSIHFESAPDGSIYMTPERTPIGQAKPKKEDKKAETSTMSASKAKNVAKTISSAVLTESKAKNIIKSPAEKKYINLEMRRLAQEQFSMEITAEETLLPIQLEIVNQLDFTGDSHEMIKQALKDKLLAAVNLKSIMETALANIKIEGLEFIDDMTDHASGKQHPKLLALIKLVSYVDVRGIIPTIFSNRLGGMFKKFSADTAQLNVEEELDKIFPILKDDQQLFARKQTLAASIRKYQSLIINYSTAYEELERNLQMIAEQTETNQAELRQWQIEMIQTMFAGLKQNFYYTHPYAKKGFAAKVNYHHVLFEKWVADPYFDKDHSLATLFEEAFASADLRDASTYETAEEALGISSDKGKAKRSSASQAEMSDAEMDETVSTIVSDALGPRRGGVIKGKPELAILNACEKGNLAKVKELLPKKSSKRNPSQECLQAMYVACASDNLEIVNYLFARIDYKDKLNLLDKDNDKTPLMIAAEKGHASVVARLFESAHINLAIKNSKGETAEALAKSDAVVSLFKKRTPSEAKAAAPVAQSAAAVAADKDQKVTSDERKETEMKQLETIHSYFDQALQKRTELQSLFTSCQALNQTLVAINKNGSIEVSLLIKDFATLEQDYQRMYQAEGTALDIYAAIKVKPLIAVEEYTTVKENHVNAVRNQGNLSERLQAIKIYMEQLNARLAVPKTEKKDDAPAVAATSVTVAVPASVITAPQLSEEKTLSDNDAKYMNFRQDKIEKLKAFNKMSYTPKSGEAKESDILFTEIQVEGVLFEMMQFMRMQLLISKGLEKSISREQAYLMSVGLIHRKDLIKETMSAVELSAFRTEVMQFSGSLIEALTGNYPFEPEATKFGQALLAHGRKLKIEKDSGGLEKYRVNADERPLCTLVTGNKRLKYKHFQSKQPASETASSWFTIRDLCASAISMVVNIASVYGLYNPTLRKVAAASRHDEKALMKPIQPLKV